MQKCARGIDAGGEAIVPPAQKNARAVVILARLHLFLALGKFADIVCDGQLDRLGQGTCVVQAAVTGRYINAQGAVARDVVLPGQLGQAPAQRREVACLLLAHAQKNSGGDAAV